MEEEKSSEALGANEKVGEYLRRTREARGLELGQMAKAIRLSPEVVQAIEDSNWSYFKIEAYLRSYLVSICEKLQIDKDEVLRILSSEINSQFRVNEASAIIRPSACVPRPEPSKEQQQSSTKFPVIEILVVLVVVAALFFVVQKVNSQSEDAYEPETSIEAEMETQSETADAEEPAPVVEEPPPVAIVENAIDTLRFECTPAPSDPTCAIKLQGIDTKMIYFRRYENRYIKRSDSAHVIVTVPHRTKILVNGTKLDYGKFNTLTFYKGELVKQFNKELR